jgi:hypothetical protein
VVFRSFVEPDSAAKTAAAKKAIALDPDSEKYRKRLAKLQTLQRARPQASRPSGRSRIAIVAVLAVALRRWESSPSLSNRTRQEIAQVPTLIVLDTALPSFTPTERRSGHRVHATVQLHSGHQYDRSAVPDSNLTATVTPPPARWITLSPAHCP